MHRAAFALRKLTTTSESPSSAKESTSLLLLRLLRLLLLLLLAEASKATARTEHAYEGGVVGERCTAGEKGADELSSDDEGESRTWEGRGSERVTALVRVLREAAVSRQESLERKCRPLGRDDEGDGGEGASEVRWEGQASWASSLLAQGGDDMASRALMDWCT